MVGIFLQQSIYRYEQRMMELETSIPNWTCVLYVLIGVGTRSSPSLMSKVFELSVSDQPGNCRLGDKLNEIFVRLSFTANKASIDAVYASSNSESSLLVQELGIVFE
jgi:hypothetical protein